MEKGTDRIDLGLYPENPAFAGLAVGRRPS